MMRILVLAGLASLLLAACNPGMNWREVRIGEAGVKGLLPCKPDHAKRKVEIKGQTYEMDMLGCESGRALFAISTLNSDLADKLQDVQASWQAATLAAMRARESQSLAYPLKRAADAPPPVRVHARGRSQQGQDVQMQGLWFTHRGRLYHAAVYAERLGADKTEPFFSGLELP